MKFSKQYADAVAKLRVSIGFLLAILFLWLAAPSAQSLVYGLPVSVLGLALRAWAAGHLEKNMTLTESGPYAWVRNPLYLGTMTTAAGLLIAARRWELWIIVCAAFLFIYLPVVELEEQHLARLFSGFKKYSHRVPKLLPRPPAVPARKQFQWKCYRRNEEYQALLGFLVCVGFLVWKIMR